MKGLSFSISSGLFGSVPLLYKEYTPRPGDAVVVGTVAIVPLQLLMKLSPPSRICVAISSQHACDVSHSEHTHQSLAPRPNERCNTHALQELKITRKTGIKHRIMVVDFAKFDTFWTLNNTEQSLLDCLTATVDSRWALHHTVRVRIQTVDNDSSAWRTTVKLSGCCTIVADREATRNQKSDPEQ